MTFKILNIFGRESDHNLVDLFLRFLQIFLDLDSTCSLVEPLGRHGQRAGTFDLDFNT